MADKPCSAQTPERLATYYRAATEGDLACVRTDHGGYQPSTEYTFERVTGGRRGRVYLAASGSFYAGSGKNCFSPNGRKRLVVPTIAILDWAGEDRRRVHTTQGQSMDDVRAVLEGRLPKLPQPAPPPPPPVYSVEEAQARYAAACEAYENADVRANNPRAYQRRVAAAREHMLAAQADLERARERVEPEASAPETSEGPMFGRAFRL